MKMLNQEKPLWLPSGSVRSVLALAIVGAYIGGYIPIEVAMTVIGFYFGARTDEK